jgi:CubicO group peptidase (beta-lactamase class C family)
MEAALRKMIAALLAVLLLTASAFAQGLPKAKNPEEVGFSSERLKKIAAVLNADIEAGKIPGAVVLLTRKGKIAYFEAFGFQEREKKISMKRDSIFRIASMTKPFTSLAIMMLAEDGKLQLAYPVSKYLPEFKDLKVGVERSDPGSGKKELVLEPAEREMTVQDLLRHTSGITYGVFGKSMVKDLYNQKGSNPFDFSQTNAEMVTKLSKLPLQYQPGTTWDYSMSTDVLGRIVEVVSGKELDVFIDERISKPLKLSDTLFWAEGEKRVARLAEPQIDPATNKKPGLFHDSLARPKWIAGGAGLLSTAADYARFCQMLLNGGALDKVRLVSPKTVELMTANHLPPGTKYSPVSYPLFQGIIPSPEAGQGFGLGFAVRTDPGRNALPGSVGDYFWAGAYGTFFWIDPKEQMSAILMMHAPSLRLDYRYLIRNLVYQALVK